MGLPLWQPGESGITKLNYDFVQLNATIWKQFFLTNINQNKWSILLPPLITETAVATAQYDWL
jgi:hypothetical protein